MNDTEILDWLEQAARRSSTGISFDWIPSVEGEPSGFRFMRRFFIGEPRRTLRSAIEASVAAALQAEHEVSGRRPTLSPAAMTAPLPPVPVMDGTGTGEDIQ